MACLKGVKFKRETGRRFGNFSSNEKEMLFWTLGGVDVEVWECGILRQPRHLCLATDLSRVWQCSAISDFNLNECASIFNIKLKEPGNT